MNPDLLLRTDGLLHRADKLDRRAWVRVRRGVYYPAAQWRALYADARHALLVQASVPKWSANHLVSHWSAAALHGLPTIGGWPARVHVTVVGRGHTTQHGLRVHRVTGVVPPTQEVAGIRVTTPLQTTIDLARCTPLRSALATADHCLHNRLFDRDSLIRAADALPAGARGRAMARLVAELADALAESPLESMSRAVMFEHRLPRPELQVRLEDAAGFFGHGDFGWPGVVGECDGEMKYGADLNPEDPSAGIRNEKWREDRIRRFSTVARWGWTAAFRELPMLRELADRGIRPMPDQPWFV